jgi:S-adenosylmethionine:tRNA ribosyltransferase-isomerase
MNELDAYDFDLPRELIAQQPLPHRVDARLLVVDRQHNELHHAHVRDLPEYLKPGDALVLNESKVIPARIVGYRERTGAKWQGLYLASDENGFWKVLGKTRANIEPGERIILHAPGRGGDHVLRLLVKLEGGLWAARPEPDELPLSLLSRIGRVPLPPYIRDGEMGDDDTSWYQTVYAEKPGSVAAPTAGLHFTPALLERIAQAGVTIARVTLHVGVGTFRPITVERLADHAMHSEFCEIDAATVATLETARVRGHRIVAVGTTSVRTLEAASLGGKLAPLKGETSIFIRPGHAFQSVDAMMTNFHLPRSTLLVLVRTFGGDALLRRAYQEAIEHGYRFYSYGDAMLII